jgi:urea transport system permease protein
MGGLFIVVVMFFPDGLAGVWEKYSRKFKFFKQKSGVIATVATSKITKNDTDVTNTEGAKA